MNYKRKRSKRQVRCTMCTKYSWRGNARGRRPVRDLRKLELPTGKMD